MGGAQEDDEEVVEEEAQESEEESDEHRPKGPRSRRRRYDESTRERKVRLAPTWMGKQKSLSLVLQCPDRAALTAPRRDQATARKAAKS